MKHEIVVVSEKQEFGEASFAWQEAARRAVEARSAWLAKYNATLLKSARTTETGRKAEAEKASAKVRLAYDRLEIIARASRDLVIFLRGGCEP